MMMKEEEEKISVEETNWVVFPINWWKMMMKKKVIGKTCEKINLENDL